MPAKTKTVTDAARVDAQLINKAVGALLKHHTEHYAAKSDSLLGNDSIISVHIGLEKVPTHPSPKPKRVTIPHSIYKTGDNDASDLEEPSVCLIVKEDSKEWIQELISQFPNELGLVKKVLGLNSLRKKHAKFQQQRDLLARFDVFMADDRILPMLAKACGKHFFAAKKQPIPICVTRKTSLPSVILQSLRSTYWYLSQGTCLAIKVGTTAMPAAHVMENIAAVCAVVPARIPRQWANIRSIAIKTTHSTSLPIYNKTPSELMDIALMAGLEVNNGGASSIQKTKKIDATPTKEQAKEAMAAKKKRKAKSPLIKALKKQQDEEEKTLESKLKKQKTTDSSSKKKQQQEKVEKSPDKKRKMSMDKSDTPTVTKKTSSAKKAKVETPTASSAKKAKVETPTASSAKKAKVETPTASSAKKAKVETPTASSAKKAKVQTPKASSTKKAKVQTPKASSSEKVAAKVETPKASDKKAAKAETPKSASKKAAKAETPKSASKKAAKAETPKSASKKAAKAETPKSASKKAAKAETPKSAVKKAAKAETPKSASKKAAKAETPKSASKKADATYMAAKKFAGSKKGYAFKLGTKGLGYYADVKPKVDPKAIEAFRRMASSPGRGGGGSNSGKKPKRRNNRR